jgi:hypothetical protein
MYTTGGNTISGSKLEFPDRPEVFSPDKRHGGQVHDGADNEVDFRKTYVADILNRRVEAFGKLGFIYPEAPHKSIGNIVSVQLHDLQSTIGLKTYDASQKSLYYQSIYQNIIGTTDHEYKAGVSLQLDRLDENYNGITFAENPHDSRCVYGIYTYQRRFHGCCRHARGLQQTNMTSLPLQLHLKYNFSELTILRLSGGKSFREPYLIADNISVFVQLQASFGKRDSHA